MEANYFKHCLYLFKKEQEVGERCKDEPCGTLRGTFPHGHSA